ncbi:minichromosome maintenance protein MCM [Candidatus Woesearchaeota archaeon]|nr:minichromosome maintenance protein MCM [Candidatus Woesearchaeota archaeon]
MEEVQFARQFYQFFDEYYHAEILEKIRKGENFLLVDFAKLAAFEPELADELLERPDEVIQNAELAFHEFDLGNITRFKIRFVNLPAAQRLMISNIRSLHIGKFLLVEGIVRQKSDVRPQVVSARFECPQCGNIIPILQLENTFREPSRCSCGRKGKFVLLGKELVDAQKLVLEEAHESMEGGEQPKRIGVFLKDDLVSPLSEKRSAPGTKVRVLGIVKEVPITLNSQGTKSVRFDLQIEANNVEAIDETFYDLVISKEEEAAIKKLGEDQRIMQKLAGSIAPSVYGYEKIKESLVLQMMGGVHKVGSDGSIKRGDIHILLVGDPGAGKSMLLKRINIVAPKSRYISGKGISAAGLTASVVKDEFLKGWSLEAGAMVLASNGICCIDELDKMSKEDSSAMHEALENQTISISKANVQATLIARTTVLAAANPKLGRFDQYGIIAEQIDLPPALINRFDLIFPIKDLPNRESDELMAEHILNLHHAPEKVEQEIPTKLLKKYFAFAKQRLQPRLTEGAMEEIKSYYLKMRMSGGGEEGFHAIPISARQLDALVRLSEAAARVRLDDKVTRRDAKKAIELLEYCLLQVGLDPETGKIDIDRIATGVGASQRSAIFTVKEILHELEQRFGKQIPVQEVVEAAREKGIDETKTEDVLDKLRRSGDVFEPKRGYLQLV